MATEVGSLYYDLNIDDRKLKGQLDRADKGVKRFGARVGQYWGASTAASQKFMLGITAAGAAAVAFGKSAVTAYQESAQVAAQTNAVLKSTGNAAGITADEVAKLAKQLEFSSLFTDEQVQSAQNLLLTFTKIGKDVFPDATKIVVDMSQALGQDLKSSSIQVGKALQDPILGVSALRRVGVNFSKDQQEVIKKLVDSGQSAKAQAMILKELQTEFGGSAQAALAAAGPFAIIGKLWDDLKETVGGLIFQAITPLAQKLGALFNRLGGSEGIINRVSAAFERVRPHLPIIAGAIAGALTPAIIGMTLAFAKFLLVIAPWMIVGAALVYLWTQHRDWLMRIWAALQNVGGFLARVFIPVWNALKMVFDFLFPSVVAIFNSLRNNLLPALRQVWSAVVRLWNALNPALMTALKIVAIIIGGALVVSIKIWLVVLNVVIKVLSAVISVISNVIKWISNLISWFGSAATAVARAAGAVASWFKRLPGMIKGAIGDAANMLFDVGKQIIGGLVRGIKNMAAAPVNAVKDVGRSIINGAKSLLGIQSPSKVFNLIGQMIGKGLSTGVLKTKKDILDKIKDVMGAAVKKASDAYKELKKQRADFIGGVRSGLMGAAGLTSMEEVGKTNPITFLRDKLSQLRDFRANLGTLIKRGVDKSIIAEIVNAGLGAGSQLAKQLATMSGAELSSVNQLQAAIGKYSGSIGSLAGNLLYSGQVRTAERDLRAVSAININIGTIKDKSDADYIFRRLDSALRKQLRGVAPQ